MMMLIGLFVMPEGGRAQTTAIHPREARGVVNVPGFELAEYVENQEQPGRLPALLAEPTKSDKLQASPRGRVLPSCVDYTVEMFDSYGDGWQGAVLHAKGSSCRRRQ